MGICCSFMVEDEPLIVASPKEVSEKWALYGRSPSYYGEKAQAEIQRTKREKLRQIAPYQDYENNKYWKSKYFEALTQISEVISNGYNTYIAAFERPLEYEYNEFDKYFFEVYFPWKIRQQYGYNLVVVNSGNNRDFRITVTNPPEPTPQKSEKIKVIYVN